MQERGANLLLDRAAVVLGMVDVDVTRVTIQRLDPEAAVRQGATGQFAARACAANALSCRAAAVAPFREAMADTRFYDNRGPFHTCENL